MIDQPFATAFIIVIIGAIAIGIIAGEVEVRRKRHGRKNMDGRRWEQVVFTPETYTTLQRQMGAVGWG